MKNLKSSFINSGLGTIMYCILIFLIESKTMSRLLLEGSIFFVFLLIGELFIFPFIEKKFQNYNKKSKN